MDRAIVGVREMEIKESQFVLHMCPRIPSEVNFLSYKSLVGIWFPGALVCTCTYKDSFQRTQCLCFVPQ